jgi:glycosyltransferase involved in cell wall biosynthesis
VKVLLSDGDRRKHAESGYGQLAAGLARDLPALGIGLADSLDDQPDVALFVCPPSSIKPTPGVPRAAFTMHELDHLPEAKADWIDILNGLDLVITPTAWNQRIWRNLGVTVPIEVAPLGIDPDAYFPSTGRRCTFLSVHENLGSDSSRENWRDTLTAYYGAFFAADPVLWRVKTWKWKPDAFEDARRSELQRHRLTDETAPMLEVIDHAISSDELRSLYQGASLFIKNANREGWSLPCSEAVACGTPVAATEIQPLLSHLPDGTQWFTPGDPDELRFVLRQTYRRWQATERRVHRYTTMNTARWVERALRARILAALASS